MTYICYYVKDAYPAYQYKNRIYLDPDRTITFTQLNEYKKQTQKMNTTGYGTLL